MIENLELLYQCFNQYVFQSAKDNIKDLEIYFNTNPSTSGNPLVMNLLSAIKHYDLASIGLPLFQSILIKSGKTKAEADKVINDITMYKMCTKEQVEPAKKLIKDIAAELIIQSAGAKFKGHPSDMIGYLKTVDFKSTDSDVELSSTGFGNLDLNSFLADGAMDGIPSKFDFINETFKPECRYNKSSLNLICMPPGTGKTLFGMQECLNMALLGYKTHYLCMGDMGELDFIVRMAAMYFGVPFHVVKENIARAYEGLKKAVGNNLDITVIPASKITVDEYVDFIKDKPYDACFIDYDSQFKSTVFTDSMYLVYGEIYAKLSELTVQYHKLVFILCQPGRAALNLEPCATIDASLLSESLRKIQTVDWALTRTRERDNLNGLGIFKIIKSRRGEENVVAYSIRLNNGRFRIIPRSVYHQILQVEEKRDYTDAEIDKMINDFNQALSCTNNMVNNQMNSNVSINKGPSPFGKP